MWRNRLESYHKKSVVTDYMTDILYVQEGFAGGRSPTGVMPKILVAAMYVVEDGGHS